MLERDRRKCDGLHVVIVPHEKGLGGFSRHWGEHDEAAARWRLWHIVIPACALAGATVTLAARRSQARQMMVDPFWWEPGKQHFIFPMVDAARGGETIPKLRATDQARRFTESWMHGMDDDQQLVTLTLRNQSTDPSRNTGDGWFELRDWLTDQGYGVQFLNDTQQALQLPNGDFAVLDIDMRLALYEAASMNFIGNNGPQALLSFSDAPYRGFIDKAWPDHWKQYFHMEVGDQLPWANANQRLVYKPDTFDVMSAELPQHKVTNARV